MPQSNNDTKREGVDGCALPNGLLTLKEIAERLSVSYGRLRGFADAEGVAAFVGAQDVPGVKGARYAPSAEALFRNLIEAQDAGLVTPRTARAWLLNLRSEPGDKGGGLMEPGALVPVPRGDIAGLLQSNNETIIGALDRIAELLQSRIEPVEDRLIDREEAAQLLACAPGSVRRFVRPVRRGRWRRSDVLRYIAGLRQ